LDEESGEIVYKDYYRIGIATDTEQDLLVPVVKDDQIVIRTMMPLVVAFDHRLLDGATMARFMNHIIHLLEDPMRMLVDVV